MRNTLPGLAVSYNYDCRIFDEILARFPNKIKFMDGQADLAHRFCKIN